MIFHGTNPWLAAGGTWAEDVCDVRDHHWYFSAGARSSGRTRADAVRRHRPGQPLATAGRILVQVMPQQRYCGTIEGPPGADGFQALESRGGSPIQFRTCAGSIRLKRPDADTLLARPLAPNVSQHG